MKSYEFQAKTVEKAIEKDEFSLENLFEKEEKPTQEPKEEKQEEILASDDKTDEKKDEQTPVVEIVEEVIVQEVPENESVESKEIAEAEQEVQEKPKKERVYSNNKGSKEFIEGLLSKMGINGSVEIEEQEEHSKAVISTEQAGAVIGYRGECLSAIQYLSNIVEQKQNKTAKRLIVDVADYRERRDDSIKDMADRMARKALKMRKAIKLKPMNAYERRIVHSYLQKFEGIITHSVGVEPHRCLIIDIKRD